MSAVVERQRWLAWLAGAVALPLPLTGVVGVQFLLPFLIVAMLVAISRRPVGPLPLWLENVLAIPLLVVVAVAGGGLRYGVLRPVTELAVLLAAVRLPGCGYPQRTRLTASILALVGIGGVASSTHPTLVVYLLVVLVLVVVAVGRLTCLAVAEPGAPTGRFWPSARLVGATVVLSTLFAAPLFVFFPRLRSPFAVAPLGGQPVSGYRTTVSLNGIGDIQQSRTRALTVRFPGAQSVQGDWLMLRGSTAQHYRRGLWTQGRRQSTPMRVPADGRLELVEVPDDRPLARAEIRIDKPTDTLFVPPGVVAVELPTGLVVRHDPCGELRVFRLAPPFGYGVLFDSRRIILAKPNDDDLSLPARSARFRELARNVTRDSPNDVARALSLEQYLQVGFTYTTELSLDRPMSGDPIERFLFEDRRGHCEFFASALVLLLRAVDIPARLQVGYAGGEPDGVDGFVVRDSNAHAWVVAWVDEEWRIFDPTPPAARPGFTELARGFRLATLWQRVESLWDRWILTLSMQDQIELVQALMEQWALHGRDLLKWLIVAVAGTFVAVRLLLRMRVVVPQWLASRQRAPVVRALGRIVVTASSKGCTVSKTSTPRQLAAVLASVVPNAKGALAWLVGAHERARYGGASPPPVRQVRACERTVLRELRRR
jgi:transglutaminase-like putative cysteine protease